MPRSGAENVMHNIMLKHLLLILTGLVLLAQSAYVQLAFANANPEDTLPKVLEPKTGVRGAVNINRPDTAVDPKLQQLLATQITVNQFDIQGVKTIPFEEVNAVFKPHLNKQVSIQTLIDLSSKATKIYTAKGYPLSFAYIPAQDFSSNKVTVLVIEGYVGSVNVLGKFGPTESKIRSIVEPMLQEKPLTKKTMDRYSSLLSLLPGLSIQASLQLPKKRDGAAELVITANRTPITAGINVESLNPRARAIITVKANSLSSAAEQLTFTTLASQQNEQYYAAAYSQMLGSQGLMLKLDGSMYEGGSEEQLLPDLDRNVRSLRMSTSLSYPFIIDRNKSLIGTTSISATNFTDKIQSKETGRGILSKTHSRALSVGATYTELYATQSRRLQLTLSKGLDLLGAKKSVKTNFPTSIELTNPDDLTFTKLNFNFSQSNTFMLGLGTKVSLTGQYSADQVPASERVQFGGYQFGRAFEPGFIFGDSGWGVGVEVNKQIPLVYDFSYIKLLALQPYVLLESARTFQNADTTNTTNIDRMSSLALGLRIVTDVGGVLDMAVAKPLSSQNQNAGRSDDITFSLNYGLFLN